MIKSYLISYIVNYKNGIMVSGDAVMEIRGTIDSAEDIEEVRGHVYSKIPDREKVSLVSITNIISFPV